MGSAFAAGCASGATLVGLALVLPNALVAPVPVVGRVVLGVGGTVAALAAEHGLRGLRLPQTERQIPSAVVARRRPANAWRFALSYGTGLRTYLPSSSPHVLAAWMVCAASTPAVLAAAAAFGAGRGLPLLVRSLTRRRDGYEEVHQTLTRRLRPFAPLLVAGLALSLAVAA